MSNIIKLNNIYNEKQFKFVKYNNWNAYLFSSCAK